jgi:pyruvate dehydrogenase E1 component alpha subunit
MAKAETAAVKEQRRDKQKKEDALTRVGAEKALRLMRDMLLYRRFEEKAEEAYAIGKIGGFCHLHIGQEGVAAGAISPLRKDDYVITAYREHTQAIAKGISPKAVMAELYGRVDGCSKGKGGSMHMVDASVRFMGGHGIVGGQIPLGAGIAFAIRYRGEDTICLCFMGDAAVNQGSFHETLNMAAVWHLPVIFAVENNEYGMGTAWRRVSATPVEERGSAYGMDTSSVNGQDVLATYLHFQELADEVRSGGGPKFVDIQTYRFKGHSMSDPVSGTYRSKDEVEKRTRQDDPIIILKDTLTEAGVLDQSALEKMDAEVRAEAQEAADFADKSPFPEPGALYENVYSDWGEHGRIFLDGRAGAPKGGADRG